MPDSIDYYFTSVSPFTWLGHRTLVGIAERCGKAVRYRPFDLMGVWEVSDALPPARRSPTRQRYRLVELQRVAEMRGEKIITQPSNFPTNPALADHCIIAIQEAGDDPGEFLYRVGQAVWSHDRQVADEEVVGELLEKCRHDSQAILDAAGQPQAAQIRAANTRAAIEADAIGAPCYVYRDEAFWGQDRLEHLEAMITSGRVAFKPG